MVRVPFYEASPIRKSILLLALAALGLLLLTACNRGSEGSQAPSSSSSKSLSGPTETVKMYLNKCISCHGADLQGMMGDDSNLQQVGSRLTKEQIRDQIENGGGLMPAFKDTLSAKEIDALADWLSQHK